MTVTVLVVDDQELIRSGISMLLSSVDDVDVIAQASNGAEALEAAQLHRPDVIVMDLRMPVMDGVAATRRLTADDSIDSRVLILTTFDVDEEVSAALQAGAAGFVLKDAEADELVNAVRTVADGGAVVDPLVLRRLLPRLGESGHASTPGSDARIATLTAREREVLALIGAGLTNAEIAQELVISPATAKTHVSNILTKLDLRDRVQAVVLAHEVGLV